MSTRIKTILKSIPGFHTGTLILIIFLFLLILTWRISPLEIFQMRPSTAATSDLSEDFQSALDALRKEYGFPGATAAYVLKDGTTGVAATGVADVEAGTPMTVQARMLSASIGKTFVGATVVALAPRGRTGS